jgi:hypothetical protein
MRVGGEAFEHYSPNGLLNVLPSTALAWRVLHPRETMRYVVSNPAVLAMHNQLTWRRISSKGSRTLNSFLLSSEEIARFTSLLFYGPPSIGCVNVNCLGHLKSDFIIDERRSQAAIRH